LLYPAIGRGGRDDNYAVTDDAAERHPSPAVDLDAVRVLPMWSSCVALLVFSSAHVAMLLSDYFADYFPAQLFTGTWVGLVTPSLSAVTGVALSAHRWALDRQSQIPRGSWAWCWAPLR
jgi:hypothetical protein